MGLRASLEGRKISPPTGIRSPDHPARSSVAIPTELPGPRENEMSGYNLELKHEFITRVNNNVGTAKCRMLK